MIITFTVETIHHFSCGGCKQWWSIGDAHLEAMIFMFCPRCGKDQKVAKQI